GADRHRLVGMVPEVGDGAGGRDVRAVGLVVGVGPAAAVALAAQVDQVGPDLDQRAVVQPPAGGDVAAVVLDDDVDQRGQPAHQRPAFGGLEVDDDAPLIPVG